MVFKTMLSFPNSACAAALVLAGDLRLTRLVECNLHPRIFFAVVILVVTLPYLV
jgi:hypothetical protein